MARMSAPTDPSNDLLRAAARLSRWASQSASFDIPSAQARLLALLEEHGPMRVCRLARADHSSQPTITGQVRRLQASDWATTDVDPDDARAVLIRITDDGRAALGRVRAARAAALGPIMAALGPEGLDRVRVAVEVMTGLLDSATRADEPGPATSGPATSGPQVPRSPTNG
jgi:DNA-binding MarR family transcriptional regulator